MITSDSQNQSLDGLKVLVVDDNDDCLELLKLILEGFSVVVRLAKSVKEALKVLAQWEPDVLISDIAMPYEDGYSLIRQIRILEKCQQYKYLPAIAITGLTTQDEHARAFKSGFDVYTEKPLNIDFLAKVIAELVEKSPLQYHYYEY
ncbi:MULTISPECIES: response regulator [Nostocales]|uniref:Response regulator n=3 Tax=Nostocales TaxID=1161 RepID=A0A0C1RJM4_9CYAN|nr:response regulator [Tolypothrix bouteillei]KAF3890473.1 response regulator [Tolypothrix bouteillei VB521301]